MAQINVSSPACSKQLGHSDPQPATAWLIVAEPSGAYRAFPRCGGHPPADDVDLMERAGAAGRFWVVPCA